jgi:hypothetical protein
VAIKITSGIVQFILENAENRKDTVFYNLIQDGTKPLEAWKSFVAARPKAAAKLLTQYEEMHGTPSDTPAAKSVKDKKEVIITISLTDAGCEYIVDAHNCEVPDKFAMKGSRELKKAKGIVTRCLSEFGFLQPSSVELRG